jgi:archaellum component FlaC
MASDNKIQEYMDSLEQEKILIETHFANMERILRDTTNLDQQKAFGLLNNFNTLSIQYEQLCNDLITFIKIFMDKDSQEIRLYKTDELVELLEKRVNQIQ